MEQDGCKGMPIFYRLLIAFLAFVIIIAVLLTSSFYIFSRISFEKRALDEISDKIGALGYQFEREQKEGLLRDMQILVSNPILDDFITSSLIEKDIHARKVERLFLQSLNFTKSYHSICFVDQSGEEQIRVGRSGRIGKHRDFRGSRLFARLSSGAIGDIAVDGPFKDEKGVNLFSIGMSKADADIGRFGGAIIIDYSLEKLLGYYHTISYLGVNPIWVFTPYGETIAPNTEVVKKNLESDAVFDPRKHFTKEIQETPMTVLTNEGILVYQDLSVIRGSPLLRVAAIVPSSLPLKDIRLVFNFLLLVFLLSLFLAFIAAFYLSQYLSRPIVELARAATSLAKGDLSMRVAGQPTGEVGMLVDSFNHMADDLKKTTVSRDYVDNIIKNMIDTLIVISPEKKIMRANDSACSVLGYEEKELIGKSFELICEKALLNGESVKDNLFSKGYVKDVERSYLSKNGRKIPMLFTASALRDADGGVQAIICVARDITERRRLEEQLLHAQKMELVGRFAGGVAHDFNNILTAIMGYSNMMQLRMPDDAPLRTYVSQIIASSEKAANLTQSLLAFSRKQIINPKPVRLNDIVKRIEKLLLRVIGEDIEFNTYLSDEELIVMADLGQIEQILMNLATNARDAMPDGGILLIETDSVFAENNLMKQHGYIKEGSYALISVTDTGIGMDEQTRERIFEPFFTTKEVGKGTGLGLSMVYGIVKQHEGYINCYSEVGKGTTFKIYLPTIASEVKEIIPAAIQPVNGGDETVLLAEDDVEVRKIMQEALEKFGYRVVAAEDGKEAVDKFFKDRDKIQILIFDLIMPRKNGKEAYEEIKKTKPDIKVLFLSGYTANLIHKKGILEEGMNFILKPVSINDLLRKVREILDR